VIDLFLHFLPTLAALGILPLVASAGFFRPAWFGRPWRLWLAIESGWRRLARRPKLAASLMCAIQLAGVAVRWAFLGIPVPHVHDEFSYLLAGETFSLGRLTNPTHPMWVHFESAHIFHVPSYTSFYPPGQAVAIAVGYLLGHPWIGIVLSTLVMIVVVYWAARQWLSPYWALLAGLFGLCIVLGGYWTDTYWGGAVNAIAGAMVTGAAGVLRRRASALHLTVLAAGAAGCAITRPFEGLVLTVLLTGWLFWRIARKGPDALRAYARLSLPAVLFLAASAGIFLYYNYRVTGRPLTMPYSEGARQYVARRKFLFQKDPPTPVYRHKEMRDIYVGLRRTGQPQHWRVFGNLKLLFGMYLSIPLVPVFALAAGLALFGWRSRQRPLILTAVGGLAAVLTIPWINPHYYAPFATVMVVAAVAGVRFLRFVPYAGGRPFWIVAATAVCILGVRGAINLSNEARSEPRPAVAWGIERREIEQNLVSRPGRDLVIVRYKPDHNWYHEWVYNHAEIDASKIVWAREMDAANNARLFEYFKGRNVWLLEADMKPPRLTPYPMPGGATPAR